MPSFAVILPAAGQSSRFGGPQKKPFLTLAGKAIWQHSAELFWNRPDVRRVFIVVSPGDREEFIGRHAGLCIAQNATIVTGGAERFESVANALAQKCCVVKDLQMPPKHLHCAHYAFASRTIAAREPQRGRVAAERKI